MRILLSGGGTMGSVTPLIAIIQELRQRDEQIEILWIGTENGPEKKVLQKYNIDFKSIKSGKLNRFFDIKNFVAPFLVIAGMFQAFNIIRKFKPDVILTAGSFVCVPVAWAAKILKRKYMVHQLDIRTGLANKLMKKSAAKITISYPDSEKDFDPAKTVLTGNPYRQEILQGSKQKAQDIFKLEKDLATILVLGGGTGALALNQIILEATPKLLNNFQIIHLVGKGKTVEGMEKFVADNLLSRYHSYEFLTKDLKHAFAAADLVITRAGMATLTELTLLAKPMIIFPIPKTHQEDNANYFQSNNAAIVLNQNEVDGQRLTDIITQVFAKTGELNRLQMNLQKIAFKDSTAIFIQEMMAVIRSKK